MVTGLTAATPVPAPAPPRAADGFAENTGSAEAQDFLALLGVAPPTPEMDATPTSPTSDTADGNALPLAATGGNPLPLLTSDSITPAATGPTPTTAAADPASRPGAMPGPALTAALPLPIAQDTAAKPAPVAMPTGPFPQPANPLPDPAINAPMPATALDTQTLTHLERMAPLQAVPAPLGVALAAADTAANALEPLTERSALGIVNSAPAPSPANASATTAAGAPALPLLRPDWEPALAQRVRLMLDHGVQRAEVSVNPPELGPIEVRIDLQQDRSAHVSFVASHASGREALEAGAARLRELLGDAGITSVHIDVSARSFAGRQDGADTGHGLPEPSTADTDGATRATIEMRVGLLDLYA